MMDNPILGEPGIYGYFLNIFRKARYPVRISLGIYFFMFIMLPIIGVPGVHGGSDITSGVVMTVLDVIYALTLVMMFIHNRDLDESERRTGRFVLRVMVLPGLAFIVLGVLSLLLGHIHVAMLRAVSSFLIITPMLLMVLILINMITARRISEHRYFWIGVAIIVTLFALIYTFAAVLFLNDLLVDPNDGIIDFYDALFVSGQAFTTMGFSSIEPIGAGKLLTIFEALMGMAMIGIMVALFVDLMGHSDRR